MLATGPLTERAGRPWAAGIYDDGGGTGWAPHGPTTGWIPHSKSIAFIEYGIPACDKGTNQPNVFFDSKSTESATPYWSAWQAIPGGGYLPLRDDTISTLALQAIYQYWNTDGYNETSTGGIVGCTSVKLECT